MDAIDVVLRLVGVFYILAGLVLARVTLTSHLTDRALAALTLEPQPAPARAKTLWSLGLAILVLAGGVALAFLLDVAVWLFVAGSAAQAGYLSVLAPAYFDRTEAPDSAGRRQSSHAFFLYAAATLLVVWAWHSHRLAGVHEASRIELAAAATAVAGFLVYVTWQYLSLSATGRKT